MGYKSSLASMSVTTCGREHGCAFNKKHRITKGMKRLTFKDDGNEVHYCLSCGTTSLANGEANLRALSAEVTGLLALQKVEPEQQSAVVKKRRPRGGAS